MTSEWVVNPLEFVGEVEESVKKVTEEVAIEIFAGVIQRTPVRSGNLRASWRIQEGSEDDSITIGGTPESPLPPPKIPKTLGRLPKYPVVFVTNSQEYAEVVENGGPKNEPRYMVKLTLESLKK